MGGAGSKAVQEIGDLRLVICDLGLAINAGIPCQCLNRSRRLVIGDWGHSKLENAGSKLALRPLRRRKGDFRISIFGSSRR